MQSLPFLHIYFAPAKDCEACKSKKLTEHEENNIKVYDNIDHDQNKLNHDRNINSNKQHLSQETPSYRSHVLHMSDHDH